MREPGIHLLLHLFRILTPIELELRKLFKVDGPLKLSEVIMILKHSNLRIGTVAHICISQSFLLQELFQVDPHSLEQLQDNFGEVVQVWLIKHPEVAELAHYERLFQHTPQVDS